MRSARSFALLAGAGLALAACNQVKASADVAAEQSEKTAASVVDLDPGQLATRLEGGDVQLIDVRTPEEFAEGHIAGAINVPVDTFDPATLPDADGKEVILYCRSGRRSGIAGEKLAAHTGKAAEHLGGGILAWDEAGQPTAQ